MRTTASGRKNGIFSLFWTIVVQINYLDFVDDLALLSHHQRQMKDKNSIIRSGIQDQSRQQKTEDHHHFPNTSRKYWWPIKVEPFIYPGSMVGTQSGQDRDIKPKIGKASAAFTMLKNIWLGLKVRINCRSLTPIGSHYIAIWSREKENNQIMRTLPIIHYIIYYKY